MRERLAIQKQVGFTPSQVDKIQDTADRLGVSFSEIVRECVINELPRLDAREKKRVQRRTQRKAV